MKKYNITKGLDETQKMELRKRVKEQSLVNFAINLCECIEEKNVSLDELSKVIEVSKASLSDYTRGNTAPSIIVIDKLASYFEVTVDYLLGRTKIKKPKYDNFEVEKRLGLSEKAIEKLELIVQFSHETNDSKIIDSINEILTNQISDKFFGYVSSYLHPDIYLNQIKGYAAQVITTKGTHLISAKNLSQTFSKSKITDINEILFELKKDIEKREKQ